MRNRIFVTLTAVGVVLAASALVITVSRKPSETPVTIDAPRQTAPVAPAVPQAPEASLAPAIEAIAPSALRADLEKLYAENENRRFWTDDRAGHKRLASVDKVIDSMAAQGIDAAFLENAKAGVLAARVPEDRINAEVRMSAALLRAAHGLRFGFVSAKDLGWNLAPDQVEVAAFLGQAAARNDITDYFDKLRPQHAQYRALTDALTQYRQIAAAGGWPAIPDGKEIDFASDTRLPILRDRLAAEGYLPMSADIDGTKILDAVKAYQARNGLEPDGRAGKGTLAAMNVPVEARIDQILANLERWRHMRHDEPDTYVVANVADQHVVVMRDGREDLRLRTVVGTRRHATPMLEATMTAVTLNPPWEIPTSIITNEILPKLDEEPEYLLDNRMEVVSGSWDKPRSLRIRQRPGVGNSLGHMKFQMQNQWNIYLHDTPSRALFAKDDRYFSHGCVRVHEPHELAVNLLSGWDAEKIHEVIASGETRTIKLDEPLPVFVLYWTAFTDKDGKVQFRRDAYDRDTATVARLAQAGVLQEKAEVVQSGN